jgi:hypothetical protein
MGRNRFADDLESLVANSVDEVRGTHTLYLALKHKHILSVPLPGPCTKPVSDPLTTCSSARQSHLGCASPPETIIFQRSSLDPIEAYSELPWLHDSSAARCRQMHSRGLVRLPPEALQLADGPMGCCSGCTAR